MEIIIPLPKYTSINTYKELKGYLKQLELAIHHAQKSVESAEEMGVELTKDSFVKFDHPSIESSLIIDSKDSEVYSEKERKLLENFMYNYYEELQNVELKINLE
jgi:hypothetical protein